MRRLPLFLIALCGALAMAITACSGGSRPEVTNSSIDPSAPSTDSSTSTPASTAPKPFNAYEFTQANQLDPSVAGIPTRVYVPNGESNTVTVIDPATFEILETFPVGRLPQHVVPSHNMDVLYVNNNQGNTLTPIDPRTGARLPDIPIDDPYNLYFSPDGTKAIVMAERNNQVDFYDPNSWSLIKHLNIPHRGVNHAEFSPDGKTMIASCEFSGYLVRIDVDTMEITGELNVGGKPVDLKLSPDGGVVYNANENRDGISIVDWQSPEMRELQFIATGDGTHGLYPSRDGKQLYISNRLGGSVSVLDFATNQIVDTWHIGGSPDMGGVSTDGTQLWLSGRYNSEVYVIDTKTGALIRKIPVGKGPHGLAYFPQPGRYSMGHTGNFR
jgi:YVTN family beta-propeller protein